MKISIITVCRNRKDTIRDTIESVLAQDYHDMEYIVVDGASTDGTTDIIQAYRNQIAVMISEPDGGMYEAINKGIKLATGDVIGLVHSDDVLFDSHTVAAIAERFQSSHADLVYGDGLFVDATNPDHVVRDWRSGKYSRLKVKCGWLPLHPTCYIRRSVMMTQGLYDERYKIAADTDLLVRYLCGAELKVEYLQQYVIRMRMGGLSTTSSQRRQMWREDVSIYAAHGFPGVPVKLMKMMWKVPQFVRPWWHDLRNH